MWAVLVLPSQEAWEGQDPSVLLAWLPATRASCAPSPQQKGVGTGCRCQPRAKVCSWHAGARGTWTSRVHLPSPSPPPAPPSAPTHITPPSRKSPSTPLQSSGGRSQGRCFNSKPSCVAEPLPSASARTSPAPYSPGSTGLKLPGRPSAEMALGEPVPAAAPAACSEPRRPGRERRLLRAVWSVTAARLAGALRAPAQLAGPSRQLCTCAGSPVPPPQPEAGPLPWLAEFWELQFASDGCRLLRPGGSWEL